MEYITQISEAKNGIITEEVLYCAKEENIDIELIRQNVADGKIVIVKNNKKSINPIAIGNNLRTKISADLNVDTNENSFNTRNELDKLRVIEQAGADIAILNCKGNYLQELRSEIVSTAKIPIGTNPLAEFDNSVDFSFSDLITKIEKHCKDGIDFMTLPCGFNKSVLKQIKSENNILSPLENNKNILIKYMLDFKKENPIYRNFDRILEILKEYDVVLNLCNISNPMCIADSESGAQLIETKINGELTTRAQEAEVQVTNEFGGHIPVDKIASKIKITKELTDNVPIYSIGPMVLDNTIGYNDITSAIGASEAAIHGANILNCPIYDNCNPYGIAQIKNSIITAKIAAQSADITRNNTNILKQNTAFSLAQSENNKKVQINNALDKTAFSKNFRK